MLGNPCPGRAPHIQANIEAIRLIDLPEDYHGMVDGFHQFSPHVRVDLREFLAMLMGQDQQMAGGVRVAVKDHKSILPPVNQVILVLVRMIQRQAKGTFFGV